VSTYWYFECLDHLPALRSIDEFTQHTDDGAYRAGVELAQQRPLDAADYSTGTGHFEGNARSFLTQHPTCALGLVNEYGERRSLPTPSAEPGSCPVCGGTGQSHDDSHRHSTLPTIGRCDACSGTGRASAEPVSIADMAPGTRFTASLISEQKARRFAVPEPLFRWWVIDTATTLAYAISGIDPSTIRDVTSPPATSGAAS
jgi:hypothetical protein